MHPAGWLGLAALATATPPEPRAVPRDTGRKERLSQREREPIAGADHRQNRCPSHASRRRTEGRKGREVGREATSFCKQTIQADVEYE